MVFWLLTLALAAGAAATPPQLDGGYAIGENDYPIEARRSDIVGHVGYQLDVDSAGRPTACTVTSTSWSRPLDEAACRLVMARAHFKPARDANGQPIAGTYAGWTRWELRPVATTLYSGQEVRVEFDTAGEVVNCKVMSLATGGGVPISGSDKCNRQGNATTFAAWLDRPTAGLRSAAIRTVMTSGAPDYQLGTTMRRIIAEARFEQDRNGKVAHCEMSVASRYPGEPEASVDLCMAGALKPTISRDGSPVAMKRLTIEVVATER